MKVSLGVCYVHVHCFLICRVEVGNFLPFFNVMIVAYSKSLKVI